MTGPCGRVQYTALRVTVLCKINGKEIFCTPFQVLKLYRMVSVTGSRYVYWSKKHEKRTLGRFRFSRYEDRETDFFVFDRWLRITEIIENFLVFKFGGKEASPWAGVVVACFMTKLPPPPHDIPRWSPGDRWGCPGDAGGRFGDVPKDPQASPNCSQQVPTHPQSPNHPHLEINGDQKPEQKSRQMIWDEKRKAPPILVPRWHQVYNTVPYVCTCTHLKYPKECRSLITRNDEIEERGFIRYDSNHHRLCMYKIV